MSLLEDSEFQSLTLSTEILKDVKEMHKIKKLGEHAIFSNPMSKIACLPDFLIFSISLRYFNSKKN